MNSSGEASLSLISSKVHQGKITHTHIHTCLFHAIAIHTIKSRFSVSCARLILTANLTCVCTGIKEYKKTYFFSSKEEDEGSDLILCSAGSSSLIISSNNYKETAPGPGGGVIDDDDHINCKVKGLKNIDNYCETLLLYTRWIIPNKIITTVNCKSDTNEEQDKHSISEDQARDILPATVFPFDYPIPPVNNPGQFQIT